MCQNLSDSEKLDQGTLCANMPPHKRYKNFFERTTMPGELEAITSSKLRQRPIIVHNSKHSAVHKYGMEEFSTSLLVIIISTKVEEDVDHYDWLLLRQQHVIAAPKNNLQWRQNK